MNTDKLIELLNKKRQEREQNKRKILKPPKGSSRYVLLPGWNPAQPEVFWHDYGEHWCKDINRRDAKGQAKIVSRVVCEEKTHHKDCPICNALRDAMDICVSDEQRDALRANFGSHQSYLVNVLALDSENPTEPQVLGIGVKMFDTLIELVEKWSKQIFDPKNPQTFTITRNGEGINTTYTVSIDPTTTPLPKDVMEKLVNLDEFCASSPALDVNKGLSCFKALGVSVSPVLSAPKPTPAIAAPAAVAAATVVATPVAQAVASQVAPQPVQPVKKAAEVKPVEAVAVDTELDSLLADLNVSEEEAMEDEDIPF